MKNNKLKRGDSPLETFCRRARAVKFGFVLCFCLLSSTGGALYAQTPSAAMKNVKIEDVFNRIEKNTSYVFLFKSNEIDTNRLVSLDNVDGDIESVLDQMFRGTNVDYKLVDNQILLSKKDQQVETIKATGVVKDQSGEPLIGVNVMVVGTNAGTVTNMDGEFSLDVPKGASLEFRYIGYTNQKRTITSSKLQNITLSEDTKTLDEVVVTALGIKREEKALSYNVQVVKDESLTTVKSPNFVNSLNGKVAGVTINKSSSGPGGAARVVMRGAKSIEGDNNVLYVIDGIPIFNNTGGTDSGVMGEGRVGSEGIADFNPDDIESVSVLSGPSAAALYGSSAANGAILITTKQGQEGKLQVSFSSSTEFTNPFIMPEFQNTYGNKPGEFASWGDKLATRSSYDPKKDFFNTGHNLINSLTISAGNQFNRTFASVASTNSTGIVPNNTYDRVNLTIRNTTSFFDDKLKLDLGSSYIKQKHMNMVSQGQYWNPILSAYLFPRGENFKDIKTFERYDSSRDLPAQYWPLKDGVFANQNPYWTAYRNLAPSNKDRFMFNAGLTYEILDWLNVAGRFRMDRTFITDERKVYATSDEKFAKSKGNYEYSNYKDNQSYVDFMVNINKRFGDFNLVANLGTSYSDFNSITRGYGGNLVLVPNLFSINNIDPADSKVKELGGDSRVRNVALFASMELGWRSMLYLTLTGRNDWNSRLVNSNEESFFYPSVGLSAIISEMVKLPEAISFLKVRGSFTEVGAPISKSGLTPGTITTPIVGGVLKPTGIYPYGDFKAERTKSYEVGLAVRFLKSISFEATWYKSNTYNQTFIGDLPESSGYKSVYLQAGNVQNKGIEMSLGYDQKFNEVGVSSTLSFSRNKNKIKEMVKDYRHPLNPDPFDIPEVVKENGRVILKVGGSINDVYANKFLKKDNQGFIYIPESGEITLENTEPVYLGKTTPDFMLGWNNTITYKRFGLSFLINGRFGGIVTSSTQAIMDKFGVSKESAIARDNGGVMLPNQGLYDAEKYYNLVATGDSDLAGYYTYSATNIRLQELALSYSFPSSWFKNVIKDLSVSFIANNLWMIYCKAPYDPELTASTGTYGQGNDYFMQPSLRSLGFGIKVKF